VDHSPQFETDMFLNNQCRASSRTDQTFLPLGYAKCLPVLLKLAREPARRGVALLCLSGSAAGWDRTTVARRTGGGTVVNLPPCNLPKSHTQRCRHRRRPAPGQSGRRQMINITVSRARLQCVNSVVGLEGRLFQMMCAVVHESEVFGASCSRHVPGY
jgi:hypothetical protein